MREKKSTNLVTQSNDLKELKNLLNVCFYVRREIMKVQKVFSRSSEIFSKIIHLIRLLSNTEINDSYHYLTAQEVKHTEREA